MDLDSHFQVEVARKALVVVTVSPVTREKAFDAALQGVH